MKTSIYLAPVIVEALDYLREQPEGYVLSYAIARQIVRDARAAGWKPKGKPTPPA